MAKNKKTKKTTQKVSVGQTVKVLSKPSAANGGYGSKSGKPMLTITGISGSTVNLNGDSSAEEVVNNERLLSSDSMDHSLTREPINLGVKNVRQILKAVKDATLEVKDLILNECNIIYECKICTNLFRSLANFLAHKRIYCKNHFCERMVLFDSTHVQFNDDDEDNCDDNEVEEEDQHNIEVVTPVESGAGTAPKLESPVSSSTPNSSVENIIPNTDNSIESKKRKFITNCVKKVEDERRQEECHRLELQLTSIKTNPNAVFQSVQSVDELNDDSNQSLEYNKLNKKQIISQLFKDAKNCDQLSDSKSIKRQRVEEILPPIEDESELNGSTGNESPENESFLKCDICDSTFTSNKTLRVHLKTIHSTNRLVYPCPLCSLTFKQLSNATRHLIQIHKRSKTQANGLKEVMKRRAYSANTSENSSEVEDMSDDNLEEEVPISVDSNEAKDCENTNKSSVRSVVSEITKPTEKHSAPRISSSCVYNCGNAFDWAPAKRSHEKSCRKKWELENGFNDTNVETNGSTHSTVVSKHYNRLSYSQTQSESGLTQDMPTVPTHTSSTIGSNSSTNLILPNSVEERIREFADLKSLRCNHCPTQDFMNLNQILQHAVTHIGYSIYKCHGCSYHSIYENDMKYHLMNSHNINEDMINKHYQTLPNLTQPRLLIQPIQSSKQMDSPPLESDSQSGDKNTKLKIHLRTMGNTSRKCYEIVDK